MTATASGKTLDDLLLCIRSTSIGPNLPLPREILHKHTEECPAQPSNPISYEQVRNYLLDKKEIQKKYHNLSHNVKPLPELTTGQKVLFLSPKEQNQYIKGTITTKAPTPRSYYIQSQGKTYCHTCQHIHTMHNEIHVLQDHQQPQIPVSQDHQQPLIHVSQDHQQPQIPVSQDHYHKKICFTEPLPQTDSCFTRPS